MKLLICLLFLSVTLLVRTEVSKILFLKGILKFNLKPEQVCENGKYPPDPSTSFVPTYVVNLDLPPSQRWQELSRKYQKPVKLVKHFYEELIQFIFI